MLLRKAGHGSRLWGSSKVCLMNMSRKTLSLTMLPLVLVLEAGNSSRLWSSSKQWWVNVRHETL